MKIKTLVYNKIKKLALKEKVLFKFNDLKRRQSKFIKYSSNWFTKRNAKKKKVQVYTPNYKM